MPESDIYHITCRTHVFKNLSCRTVLGTIMVPKSIKTRPQKNLSHRGKKNLSLSAVGFPSLSGTHACRPQLQKYGYLGYANVILAGGLFGFVLWHRIRHGTLTNQFPEGYYRIGFENISELFEKI